MSIPETILVNALQQVEDGPGPFGTQNLAMSALYNYRAELFGRIAELAALITASRDEEMWRPANEIWKIAGAAHSKALEEISRSSRPARAVAEVTE